MEDKLPNFILLMYITVIVFDMCYSEATYKCVLPKFGIVLFLHLVKLDFYRSALKNGVGMSGLETSLKEKLLFIFLCTDLSDAIGYSESDKYKIRFALHWELIWLEAEDST